MSARERMIALLPDLREELRLVEEDIAKLSQQRGEILAFLKALEPKPNGSKPKKQKGKPPGAQAVQRTAEFVQSHAEELGDFTGQDLIARADFHLSSPSTILPILKVLHEQGVLTLESIGVGKKRTYKVVA